MDKNLIGKVITALGPIEPEQLGAVMMHEHIYCTLNAGDETETPPERLELLMKYAVPNMKKLNTFGCHTIVDTTPPPARAQPYVYKQVSEAAGINIILSTGVYREIPVGSYWAKTEEDSIWHFARNSSCEELAEFMLKEFELGIGGSGVKPGTIKIASSSDVLTKTEMKAFKAASMVQGQTGVHITTHCDFRHDSHSPKAQLDILEKNKVNPERIVLGHTGINIVEWPEETRECMKRGAVFLPTNLRMDDDWEFIKRLVDSIRQLFYEGYEDYLVLGLDWGFENEIGIFIPCSYMPPPPYVYLYYYTLPRMRKLGLEEEAIYRMTVVNPKRILPVQGI